MVGLLNPDFTRGDDVGNEINCGTPHPSFSLIPHSHLFFFSCLHVLHCFTKELNPNPTNPKSLVSPIRINISPHRLRVI